MTHTPGPWRVVWDNEEVFGQQTSIVKGIEIGQSYWVPEDEAEVNQDDARLIAAAPEMYEAIEQAIDCLTGACPILHASTNDDIAARLRAAIAKAKGKS